mmetsp:Transcript_80629/g.207576  ORF Transcript_80629/g.207576 Transcript_80629/m.207576 type:complete len:200 (-) Transcript_80629:251-850(-)
MPGQERADREAGQGSLRGLALCGCALAGRHNGQRRLDDVDLGRRCYSVGVVPCLVLALILAVFSLILSLAKIITNGGPRVDPFHSWAFTAQHCEEGVGLLEVCKHCQRLLRLPLQQAELEKQEADLDGEEVVNGLDVLKELLKDQRGLRMLAQLHAEERLVVSENTEVLILPIRILLVIFTFPSTLVLLVALPRAIVGL